MKITQTKGEYQKQLIVLSKALRQALNTNGGDEFIIKELNQEEGEVTLKLIRNKSQNGIKKK